MFVLERRAGLGGVSHAPGCPLVQSKHQKDSPRGRNHGCRRGTGERTRGYNPLL